MLVGHGWQKSGLLCWLVVADAPARLCAPRAVPIVQAWVTVSKVQFDHLGHRRACCHHQFFNLALIYRQTDPDPDRTSKGLFFELFKLAADQGHPKALYALANMQYDEQAVTKDADAGCSF